MAGVKISLIAVIIRIGKISILYNNADNVTGIKVPELII